MTTQEQPAEPRWVTLANMPAEEREAVMRQRFQEMARKSEAERVTMIQPVLDSTYKQLTDAQLRAFTISRLRVWLQLDPPEAQTISRAYDVAMDRLPGPAAMRHVALAQTLLHEFSPEDQDRLRKLSPRIFGAAPSAKAVHDVVAVQPPQLPEKKPAKKGFGFWKK